jgi:hypothetical protein
MQPLNEKYEANVVDFIKEIARTVDDHIVNNQTAKSRYPQRSIVVVDAILSSLHEQWISHFMFPIAGLRSDCNQLRHNISKVIENASDLSRLLANHVRATILADLRTVPTDVNRILWHEVTQDYKIHPCALTAQPSDWVFRLAYHDAHIVVVGSLFNAIFLPRPGQHRSELMDNYMKRMERRCDDLFGFKEFIARLPLTIEHKAEQLCALVGHYLHEKIAIWDVNLSQWPSTVYLPLPHFCLQQHKPQLVPTIYRCIWTHAYTDYIADDSGDEAQTNVLCVKDKHDNTILHQLAYHMANDRRSSDTLDTLLWAISRTRHSETILLCTNDSDDTVVHLCAQYADNGNQFACQMKGIKKSVLQQVMSQKHSPLANVVSRHDLMSVSVLTEVLQQAHQCMIKDDMTTFVMDALHTLVRTGMVCHFFTIKEFLGHNADLFPDILCHCFDRTTTLARSDFLEGLMGLDVTFIRFLSRQARVPRLHVCESFVAYRLSEALRVSSASTPLKMKTVHKFMHAHPQEANNIILSSVHACVQTLDVSCLVALLSCSEYKKETQRALSPDRPDGQIWSILDKVFPYLRQSSESDLATNLRVQLLTALHRCRVNLVYHDIWRKLDDEENALVGELFTDLSNEQCRWTTTKRFKSWRESPWL